MPIEREKNLPSKYTVFSQKALSQKKASSNAVIKTLMKNNKIASVMNPIEGQRLLNALREEAKGGSLKEADFQRAVGKLVEQDSGDLNNLNKSELDVIGREVLGKRHKYIMPKAENNIKREAPNRLATLKQKMAESRSNSPVVSPRGGNTPTTKNGSSGPSRGFVPRPRLF